MRDLDETTITTAVLDQFAGTPDPRLRVLTTALVRHLHAFVQEVEPTFAEWQGAIDYLTRTGQMCSQTRQEFILLSDVLGVSMLVDAINHRQPDGATETTVLGPFFVQDAPELPLGADVSGGLDGTPLLVSGSVASSDGRPLAGACVDIWQADDEGYYDVERPDLPDATLRARFRTDEAGRFHFRSIVPSFYPIPHDGPVGDLLAATGRHPNRPAHIHFMIAADGHEPLVTHLFASDSPYLESDAVFGVKSSLVVALDGAPDGTGRRLRYDFGLKSLAA